MEGPLFRIDGFGNNLKGYFINNEIATTHSERGSRNDGENKVVIPRSSKSDMGISFHTDIASFQDAL
jgi:hypothetical protein